MKIRAKINGKEHISIDKPKMKHLRVGGKLMNIQEKIADEPARMYDYIEEIYEYIKDTFPKVVDEDIDCMATDKFMLLVKEISTWANGGYAGEQKKN